MIFCHVFKTCYVLNWYDEGENTPITVGVFTSHKKAAKFEKGLSNLRAGYGEITRVEKNPNFRVYDLIWRIL